MKNVTHELVLSVACLWLLVGCDAHHSDAAGQQPRLWTRLTQNDPDLTYEEIRERLIAANVSPSRLYDEITGFSMEARSNPVVCQVLRSLWDGEQIADFDPQYLLVPMVRLSLAARLHRCGGGDDDPQYREYVLSILEQTPDESDRMRAAIHLGVVGDDEDVERLRAYAVGPNTKVAVGAVGGLSLLDSSAAKAVLKDLAADTSLARDVRESAENALKQ